MSAWLKTDYFKFVKTPKTTSGLWTYRSPAQNSDSSGSPTPIRQQMMRNSSFKKSNLPAAPQPNRSRCRDNRMRFSFILDEDDDLQSMTTSSTNARTSFDSVKSGYGVSGQIIQEKGLPSMSGPAQASKGQGKDGIDMHTSREASPRLSESFYVDAPERLSSLPVDETIYEDALPTQTTEDDALQAERENATRVDDAHHGDNSSPSIKIRATRKHQREKNIELDESGNGSSTAEDTDLESSTTTLRDKRRSSLTPAPRTSFSQPSTATSQRLKRAALALMRYPESEEIQINILDRLRRMIRLSDELAAEGTDDSMAEESVYEISRRLRKWLQKTEEGRIVHGESARLVEHEGEWAVWIEEAARQGVLYTEGD